MKKMRLQITHPACCLTDIGSLYGRMSLTEMSLISYMYTEVK